MPAAVIGISRSSECCEEQLANGLNSWTEHGRPKEGTALEYYLDSLFKDVVIGLFSPRNSVESSILQKR